MLWIVAGPIVVKRTFRITFMTSSVSGMRRGYDPRFEILACTENRYRKPI